MKTSLSILLLFGILSCRLALAGDAYASTAGKLVAILENPKVEAAATPFILESAKIKGDFQPGQVTYILRLQRDDLQLSRFCLVVTAEGHAFPRVTSIGQETLGSPDCPLEVK